MALNIVIDPVNDLSFIESVRRLLGGVDSETLSDEDILDPAFFDLAELEVLSLVPCLDRTDVPKADKEKARIAMIHLIASKLCSTVKGRVEYEVKTIDVTWRRSPVKYDDLQDDLLATADSLLNSIECYTGTGTPNTFVVAPSKRAVRERYE
ncbi:hypothetical protein MOC55_11820 [Bacillus spizizenii]|uniref:Uncharacterized protein n=1 Tax=Bacillus spizizenii TaxID=96241 RepID=A0A9Q4DLK9_BACSC|nr:hypothetical protein [Bacillus spizizenii]MCY8155154.1 hypothetical protein [Bacillus spizizenii]MCY8196578.1 hypothetical protein [Bacillus spizizenii]MCY8219348.1 hypothetical protein [Bacillus spizizenii]MCY8312974.1 hypothetical protein [Bacillus spizizenii]